MAGCPRTPRGGRYSSDPLHRPRHLGADNLDALWVVVGPGDPGLAMLGREPPGLLDPADRGDPFRELLDGVGQLELLGRPCDRCAPMTFRQVIDSLEAAMGRAARRLRNPDALCRLTWTPGVCRRSPPAGDWWHIRQLVPAARFTAVHRSPPERFQRRHKGARGTGRGWGHAKGSVFGVRRPRGGRREPGGPVWPLGCRSGRVRPPPATRRHLWLGPLRHRNGQILWIAG